MQDLVGVTDIAERQGVAVNTAWRWSRRDDFPEPIGAIGRRPVWRWRDVERWARKRPAPGRPKRS
jgi:predicted DNA-binding transcriptional regulator AlpA